jgi:HrpA-like RNA helicase
MFPPFYRDLWMSWLDMEKQEMIDHSTWCADQRREKIEELVQSTLQVHKGFSGNKELPVSSNDKMNPQDSSYQISKLRKSSADCIQNSPTSLGTALQQQFLRRNESSSYISMLSDRRNLPIYGYRQQILDTIQKNPVTILWAETGT